MDRPSAWRLALARKISSAYASNPKVRALAVAGSVARGCADRYSDIEIDVYWAEPPSDEERRAVAAQAGATDLLLWPYEDEEWSDNYSVGGVKIELSQFLTTTTEQCLSAVLDDFDTSPDKQMRVAAVRYAIPLHGNHLFEQWQARATRYPDGLAFAMVTQHLSFDGTWYAHEMLADRDDLVFLYDLCCNLEKRLLGVLLGLNRIYLPHLRYKWMDHLIADMSIHPRDLALRMKQVFRMAPRTGVRLLQELALETVDLVDVHMPGINTAAARSVLQQRREPWDQPSDEVLAQIGTDW
jgi:hypothetical protein